MGRAKRSVSIAGLLPARSYADDLCESAADSTSLPLDVSVTWPTENPFRYREHSIRHPERLRLHVAEPAPSAPVALPSRMPRPPISVRRLLTGHGQERGRIGIELVNNLELPADVVWAEQWPWWMRGFVGTLRSTSTSMADVTGEGSRRAIYPAYQQLTHP